MKEEDRIVREMLWHVDARSDKDGWDQPARLFLINIHPVDHNLDLGGEIVRMDMVELLEIPGWQQCYQVCGDVQSALNLLTEAMVSFPPVVKKLAFPTECMYGVAVMTEAWTVRADDLKDVAKIAEIKKTASEHKLDQHPDRIETRMIFVVSMEGKIAALNHERDGVVQVYPDEETEHISGGVPDRLLALVEALKD